MVCRETCNVVLPLFCAKMSVQEGGGVRCSDIKEAGISGVCASVE